MPLPNRLRPSVPHVEFDRILIVITSAVLIGIIGCRERVVEAGFWFDPITFESPYLDGPITAVEIDTIARTARSELTSAFDGLRIRFSTRRNALYHVRVVQQISGGGAGQSRAILGFGGGGAVSFSFLATGVFDHSPPDTDRAMLIGAIGRTAVHEFKHQLLVTMRDSPTLLLLAASVALVVTISQAAQQPLAPVPAVPRDAITAIVDAYQSHSIVTLPDWHGNQQLLDFALTLLRDPRLPTVINDIVVENTNARYLKTACA